MIVEFFAFIGVITTIIVLLAIIIFIYIKKPRPNSKFIQAIKSIDWKYMILFIIAPVSIYGFVDGTMLGFIIGIFFAFYLVILQWWFEI